MIVSVMDRDCRKLRAWWAHKQGLDGSLQGQPLADVLQRTGWSRSVGGANPYLALWSRCGCSREDVDKAVASLQVHELPSARGCTYVLPAAHFPLGLACGQGFGDDASIATAVRHLGATTEEIEDLGRGVLEALVDGPLDPAGLKAKLGDRIRNYGPEGKKRGVTTNLPLALGKLQSQGKVRRVPLNGRIDNQRYAYRLWTEPRPGLPDRTDAYEALARSYFEWIGPARVKEFQWFSGLGVKAANEAVSDLDLVDVGDGMLLLRSEHERFDAFAAPDEPECRFIGSIDNLSHLRAGLSDLIDPEDHGVRIAGEKVMQDLVSVTELASHAIVDRGRLIGVWDFDPEEGSLVYACWAGDKDLAAGRALEAEAFVRDGLGDARTFSLDSPASRKGRIAGIRALSES